jgi:hypothetical protein
MICAEEDVTNHVKERISRIKNLDFIRGTL